MEGRGCFEFKKSVFVLLLFIFFAAIVGAGKLFSSENPAFEKLKDVVIHFDRVAPGIYRSGAIYEDEGPLLKSLGIKTVINLIDDAKRVKLEGKFLRVFGIEMFSIPWNGFDKPKDEVIDKALALLNTQELRPILIHCVRGSERAGLTVACWRVQHDGWTADQAYQEMKKYDFRAFWHGHLQEYLYQFAARHNQAEVSSGNWAEKAKTNVLYFFYRFRKLVPSS